MSHLDQFNYSEAVVKPVKRLQFGIFNAAEILATSVCAITKAERFNNGVPVSNGLYDPRLGVTDYRVRCRTCENTYSGSGKVNDCPGHHGHMELAAPMYHLGFMNELYKIMQCICFNCSRLLNQDPAVHEIIMLEKGKNRLKAAMKYCKGKKCGDGGLDAGGCNFVQPKFKRDGLKILVDFPEGKDGEMHDGDRHQQLTAARARDIVKEMSDRDIELVGMDPKQVRPEYLVLTVLPVAPPHVRPSVSFDGVNRGDDDLTYKYANIIKANTALRNSIMRGEPDARVRSFEDALQYNVATLIDNQLNGMPQDSHRSGRPLKTIRERLVGKGGRIRGNLMGKRVDFSARSVITGDPLLSIAQVGVPRSIARNLTVPERVTPFNMHRLQELVARGPHVHPGANYIIRDEDKVRMDLRYVSSPDDLKLRVGWIVERHLEDGDTVLFNRQPSLHKMSIMCHRAKILDYSTFRLNLTCTSPYNADFDGDEMNMHALQTLPAIAEAQELMAVPRLIVSAQANRPVMGIVQDTLLGVQKLTKRDVFLNEDIVMNLTMWMRDWDGRVPTPAVMVPDKTTPGKYRPIWTGKQIVSMIIPGEVNLKGKSSGHPKKDPPPMEALFPTDTNVIIDKGEVLCGIIDKKTVGKSHGGLIHILCNDVGPEGARGFIDQIQATVNYWLMNRGFSIGIGDSVATQATMQQISDTITEHKGKVKSTVQQAQRGKLTRQPGKSMQESFEATVNKLLNRAREVAGNIAAASLDETNNVIAMMSAGSKGSPINISQIIACVGQQNVDGARIPNGFRDRTLPHFAKGDLGPQSRGFVENSYLKGLTPHEFFFHMMGGREGLIDTAVKTAQTGYIQRRLVKAMEDCMVQYDRTVRNANGQIIQFLYGEDCMDGRWIESQPIPSFELPKRALKRKYKWDPSHHDFGKSPGDLPEYLSVDIIESMQRDAAVKEILIKEYHQLKQDRLSLYDIFKRTGQLGEHTHPLPVNLGRLIINAQKLFSIDTAKPTDLHPAKVVTAVSAMLKKLIVVPGKDDLSREAQRNATELFNILVRSTLASKPIVKQHRLNIKAFTWLVGEVENKFNEAMSAPGEMCGVVAAQSIGEPATQMTLNTFHYAGVSAKNVTLGVPRLQELINVATQLKTPALTVYLKEMYRNDTDAQQKLRAELEYCPLRELVKESEIHYDPDPTNSAVEEDVDWLEAALVGKEDTLHDISPWVLRLVLDPDQMFFRKFTPTEIMRKILEFEPTLWVVECPVEERPILLIRATGNTATAEDAMMDPSEYGENEEQTLKDLEAHLLDSLKMCGIDNITKLYTRTESLPQWTKEKGLDTSLQETVFDTDGTNLMAILSHPAVDSTRTTSNHCVEILGVLGIEACRASLLREIRNVISFDDAYVNYRHLSMLVDCMTARGHLTPITRHGINRVDNGPLQRCSFEETCEILMDAAMYAEADEMNAVSNNVMLGQLCPFGTGCFDLLLDVPRLDEAIEIQTDPQNILSAAAASDPTPLNYTPTDVSSPSMGGMGGDMTVAEFSPTNESPDDDMGGASARGMSPLHSSAAFTSPAFDAFTESPAFSPTSAGFGGDSPAYSPTSPGMSPTSPSMTPASVTYSPTSPGMSPTSPGYSPTSPAFSPTSPAMGGTSPAYSPTSPAFSPTSPAMGGTSPAYSPTSPAFSPTSPAMGGVSPAYSPTSPAFSPTSPAMGGVSPAYSPTSPAFSPTSPGGAGQGAGASPAYSPTSPAFAPSDGNPYSPTSPTYTPADSPAYSPTNDDDDGAAVAASPQYSPTSPEYSPSDASSAHSPSQLSHPTYSPTSEPGDDPPPTNNSGRYSPQEN